MKHYILTIFILSILLRPEIEPVTKLPLLTFKEKFKPEIFNCLFKNGVNPSDIVMLRIQKKTISTNSRDTSYELLITTMDLRSFASIRFMKDKYFGYFEYKGHTALVYGDNSPAYFFTMTKSKKQFDFISDKPYDYKHHPPVSIEPFSFIYTYKNGQFALTDSGMLGFHK